MNASGGPMPSESPDPPARGPEGRCTHFVIHNVLDLVFWAVLSSLAGAHPSHRGNNESVSPRLVAGRGGPWVILVMIKTLAALLALVSCCAVLPPETAPTPAQNLTETAKNVVEHPLPSVDPGLWFITGLVLVVFGAAVSVYGYYRRYSRLQAELRRLTELEQRVAGRRSGGSVRDVPTDGGSEADTVPEVPAELAAACAGKKCVLFAGGGVAAQGGLPSFNEVLKRIVERRR